MQTIEGYEYELPSDFEDEEIEEDEAFNSEDERMYGHLFADRDEDEEDASEDDDDILTSDEEENDDSEEEDDELDDVFAQVASSDDSDDDSRDTERDEQDDDDDAAHAVMMAAMTGSLPTKKKKKDVVITEAYPESEFNLPVAGKLLSTQLVSHYTHNVSWVQLVCRQSSFPSCNVCLSNRYLSMRADSSAN